MDTTSASASFEITVEAAELYEQAFVPALFAQWAPIVCEVAGVAPGRRVLDVACGTGIVARTAAGIVGTDHVVGVDANDAMLTVARRLAPAVEWRQGDAAALPFPDGSFDAVLCQMALMFFPDRVAALSEMARVASRDGTVGLVVPSALDAQPAYRPFVEMAVTHAGAGARDLLGAYFVCGDEAYLADLVTSAGLQVTQMRTQVGELRAPSVDAFVTTEVESTPLRALISDETYARIRNGAGDVLAPFTADDATVRAPFACCIVGARPG
jgi:SAM-dependent methyltransferase